MMNFDLHAFMWALILIRQETSLALNGGDGPVSTTHSERFRHNLRSVIAPALDAMFVSENRLLRLESISRLGAATYARIAHEMLALDSDAMDAAKTEYFYHYPRDKALLVIRAAHDWAKTIAAFPKAKEDIMAAVDCYALGHNHASIYHSMMVLEHGLPALARRLKVKIKKERATWRPIIDDIRNEIDARRGSMAKPAKGTRPLSGRSARATRAFLDNCQQAAMEFGYFADVWRNHVMHGRAAYDENDAKKVLDHFCAFMEIIATKLNLREASASSPSVAQPS